MFLTRAKVTTVAVAGFQPPGYLYVIMDSRGTSIAPASWLIQGLSPSVANHS